MKACRIFAVTPNGVAVSMVTSRLFVSVVSQDTTVVVPEFTSSKAASVRAAEVAYRSTKS